MDRTVIDTWKAEEKEFGEKLHRKLTALTTMIHPPTEEFKKYFVQDMFVKPNQKAFFHVMHYLFTLLDPVEFKKRFYWPIADKKSESNFRTSTVQYLMHLNEKHNLGWNNIKSYLVVMPGGMKFIVFLLDFIDFITKELIKQREKYIGSDVTPSQMAKFNIKRMKDQNKIHKEYASRYIKEADAYMVTMKENLEVLRKHMDSISIPGIQIRDLIDDNTLSEFEKSNRRLFEKNIKQKVAKIKTIDGPLRELKEVVDRFQNHETSIKCDKEMVKRSVLTIKNAYPDLEIGTPTNEADIVRMSTLLPIFNRIYPDVEKNMVVVEQTNNKNDFIGSELNALKTDLIQIETHLTKFLTSINVDAAKLPCPKIRPIRPKDDVLSENVLLSKFISTPPVKLNMTDNKLNNNPRLPFLDDFLAEPSIESFCFANQNNTLFPSMSAPRSARKNHDLETSAKQGSVKKSKIIDPARLLRTLNKDTSKACNVSRNLSSLASKWKKHESLFVSDDPNASHIEHSQTVVTTSADSSPFGSNEKTIVVCDQLDISLTTNALDTSTMYSHKNLAVQKVQDASLNFHNLSTSPSGRLEPLVALDLKECPKILLNDITLLEDSDNKSVNLLNAPCAEKSILNGADLNRSILPGKHPASDENDLNVSNVVFDFSAQAANISADTLFDISDGVLKDVTM